MNKIIIIRRGYVGLFFISVCVIFSIFFVSCGDEYVEEPGGQFPLRFEVEGASVTYDKDFDMKLEIPREGSSVCFRYTEGFKDGDKRVYAKYITVSDGYKEEKYCFDEGRIPLIMVEEELSTDIIEEEWWSIKYEEYDSNMRMVFKITPNKRPRVRKIRFRFYAGWGSRSIEMIQKPLVK